MDDSRDPETVSDLAFLADVTGTLVSICGKAMSEMDIQVRDRVTANLVVKYAQEIDNGNLATLAKVGPAFLQALEALQMSPRSRMQSAIKKGNVDDKPVESKSTLDELRAKRNERKNGTQNLHSTSTGTDS